MNSIELFEPSPMSHSNPGSIHRTLELQLSSQQKLQQSILLVKKRENLRLAKNIWTTHCHYFELVKKYQGDELLERLNTEIPTYSWERFSRLQDRIYELTQDKSMSEMQDEIADLEKELQLLEEKRRDHVHESLKILNEIDDQIEDIA